MQSRLKCVSATMGPCSVSALITRTETLAEQGMRSANLPLSYLRSSRTISCLAPVNFLAIQVKHEIAEGLKRRYQLTTR
jgi:hypothetical protein